MSSGPGPDEPTRAQDRSRRPRERTSADRARRAAGGIGAAWGNLTADQARDLATRLSSGKSKLEVVNAD